MGGTSTCCTPFFALNDAFIFAAAAAAFSAASFLLFSEFGDWIGLLDLREGSASLPPGERDLRSKRDLRGGSESVWSKRERFRGSSAMVAGVLEEAKWVRKSEKRCSCGRSSRVEDGARQERMTRTWMRQQGIHDLDGDDLHSPRDDCHCMPAFTCTISEQYRPDGK